MRLISAFFVAGLMIFPVPAQAAWEQYINQDFGFGVDFPTEPTIETGTYQGAVAGTNESTIIMAEDGGLVYKVTVVDFSDRLIDAGSILEEAVYLMTISGELVIDIIARAGPWEGAVYGRRLTVDVEDGTRSTASIFLTKGNLFIFESIVPVGGDFDSPAPGRYVQSVIFNIDWDWSVWPPVPR